MIELYTWTTPNGRKVSILLEELGIPYTVHPIDIGAGDQFTENFLSVGPNGKIPAIRDGETGLTLMESGAILLYLAEKTGRFLSPKGEERWRALEWLMWQMGGLGPMLGQAHHFLKYNPGRSDYAERRYKDEAARLYSMLEKRLSGRAFIAGDYSIADIAVWPWISRYEWQSIDLEDYPNVRRWYLTIAARPAVQAGYHQPHFVNDIPLPAIR